MAVTGTSQGHMGGNRPWFLIEKYINTLSIVYRYTHVYSVLCFFSFFFSQKEAFIL